MVIAFTRKRIILVVIVLVIVISIVAVLILNKGQLPTQLTGKPRVELKTSYENPFDKNTQYVNPFEKYKNPFVVNR